VTIAIAAVYVVALMTRKCLGVGRPVVRKYNAKVPSTRWSPKKIGVDQHARRPYASAT
jgi:hypothetical protein